ncbi:glycosyltransferase family 4 protein [Herbiconiux sp. P16]|uniref:glycosyltransferase family 4 protein n=1 Tax=Herbiconiux wuyangfengii TaxID=3342794 RepID=UPI0035BB2DB9
MKIAIDARSIASSTGTYVRNLVQHLQDIDQVSSFTIFVPQGVAAELNIRASNFTIEEITAGPFSMAEQTRFLFRLVRGRYDLVHFAMPQQPLLYPRMRVTTFHDLTLVRHSTLPRGRFLNAAFRACVAGIFQFTIRANKRLIAPTRYTRGDLARFSGINESRISVTYEAADPAGGVTEPYPVTQRPFILAVGNFYDYKNVRRLVEAHGQLRQSGKDVDLVLVGNLHKAGQLLQMEIQSSRHEGVHFTGFISDAQKNWLFQNCEVYAFPSISEGFGLPGLEAMVNGAPVVASSATCLPEVYGDAALYFDPFDPSDIAATIGSVLESPDLRNKLISAGYARAESFSWRRMADETHAVYSSLAPRPRKAK